MDFSTRHRSLTPACSGARELSVHRNSSVTSRARGRLALSRYSKECRKWEDCEVARCTAPVLGHRSASAAANCPACGSRGSRYGRYGGYSSYESYSSPVLLLFGE